MKRQPTPQHVTWFLDLYKNNQLELSPPYQRKSVWTPKDRRFFLDTIFRNYPAPPVFIHRELNDEGQTKYYVVDGKQRLETIFQFNNNKIAIDKNFGDENLNGKKLRDIPIEYKRKFWDYVLVVDFIENIEGTNIENVFDRVNRNSKNLLPQELRHARFSGWFINECENESDAQFWWNIKISTKATDKRMSNVQFISELLLIILENKIVGFDQDYLDEMYAKYDDLEELIDPLDVEQYIKVKESVKEYLINLDRINSCVSQYAKTSSHMYPLWGLLALNTAWPAPEVFAEKYKSFMEGVERVKVLTQEGKNTYEGMDENIVKYFDSSRGASTEYPQRKERLTALSTYLSI